MSIMFNEDWMNFISSRYSRKIDVNEQILKEFIYQYKNSDVSDFIINVNGTISTFPSKILESFPEKYLHTEENGLSVDYKNCYIATAYDIFIRKGLDMYAIWIGALREIGITPWISIRMNDCHDDMKKTGIRKSARVEQYSKYWVSAHRKPVGYMDRIFDYENKAVRDCFLSYVEEVLEKYDVDGIELDFMRELILFKPGNENRNYLTEMIREVRRILNGFEIRKKHKIKLSVIVAENPLVNFNAGLDIVMWANEKLIDYVCAIPRWETTTVNIPVEYWKSILGENVRFGAGQQLLFCAYRGAKQVMSSVDMAFAQAASNLSRGADFVYLYNYMDLLLEDDLSECHNTSIRDVKNNKEIIKYAGNIETAKKHSRRYSLSYMDYTNYWDKVSCRLPLVFPSCEFEYIRIAVGDLSEDMVLLQLGIESDEKLQYSDFEIYANGYAVAPAEAIPDYNIYHGEWYGFLIPRLKNVNNYMVIEMKIKSKCTVVYSEIYASNNKG